MENVHVCVCVFVCVHVCTHTHIHVWNGSLKNEIYSCVMLM